MNSCCLAFQSGAANLSYCNRDSSLRLVRISEVSLLLFPRIC